MVFLLLLIQDPLFFVLSLLYIYDNQIILVVVKLESYFVFSMQSLEISSKSPLKLVIFKTIRV